MPSFRLSPCFSALATLLVAAGCAPVDFVTLCERDPSDPRCSDAAESGIDGSAEDDGVVETSPADSDPAEADSDPRESDGGVDPRDAMDTSEVAADADAESDVRVDAQDADADAPAADATDAHAVVDSADADAGGDADAEAGPPSCPTNPPVQEVLGNITANTEWDCRKTYVLKTFVEVRPGVTLTVGPGTQIKALRGSGVGSDSLAGLVILPRAKVRAMGTKALPIVMTSAEAVPRRGDWAGVMIIGGARSNHQNAGGPVAVYPEGLVTQPQFQYGSIGADRDDNDSSGELHYVRVEYAGYQLTVGNEINSFGFYGVGSGTSVDHLQALHGFDDAFEWFGGTVNAKYLVAASVEDDCFDIDNGFRGKLQFGVCNRDDVLRGGNGFEVDNDANGTSNEPRTDPTIYNFTLIGKDTDLAEGGFGLHLRRNAKGRWFNILAVNWPLAGLHIQPNTSGGTDGAVDNATDGSLSLRNSIVGGIRKNGETAFADGYIFNAANNLRTAALADAKITSVSSKRPNFALQSGSPALTGWTAPPNDGFFTPVSFIGACSTTCTEFEGWTRYE
jgi:hypothetical protein